MQGNILTEVETGRLSVYVEAASIQIFVIDLNDGKPVLYPCRTDGYWVTEWEQVAEGMKPRNMIPIIGRLQKANRFVATIDVPKHIVEFAVWSERQRQQSIDEIASIFEETVRTGDGDWGLKRFLSEMELQKLEEAEQPYSEVQIATELLELIRAHYGGGFD